MTARTVLATGLVATLLVSGLATNPVSAQMTSPGFTVVRPEAAGMSGTWQSVGEFCLYTTACRAGVWALVTGNEDDLTYSFSGQRLRTPAQAQRVVRKMNADFVFGTTARARKRIVGGVPIWIIAGQAGKQQVTARHRARVVSASLRTEGANAFPIHVRRLAYWIKLVRAKALPAGRALPVSQPR